jgi:hypothetical protein
MKMTIIFELNEEEDGVAGELIYTKSGIDDLHSLAHGYAFATRGVGYTYVENVGFEKEDGTVTFG